MHTDPFVWFHTWLAEARASSLPEPTAMALATASADGWPAVRMVLLKHADERGFVFYTNRESPKARDLAENARAELCFYWNPPGRQVRVRGHVEHVDEAEAEAYFATRPYLSRIGAWASHQSQPLASLADLMGRVAQLSLKYPPVIGPVPKPPHWGGYRVVPRMIEFWHEKTYRLHERMRFERTASGWTGGLLNP